MGRHIALALQAFIELQSFIDETSEQELNLSNAPILFHLQHDPEMLAYIQNCENDISNLNLSQVSTYTSTIIIYHSSSIILVLNNYFTDLCSSSKERNRNPNDPRIM